MHPTCALLWERHSEIGGVPANAGNNIALDGAAARRLNSAEHSLSPAKKPKQEPSSSVSEQAPAALALEGSAPSGSMQIPAQQNEEQRGDAGEPRNQQEHLDGQQQVSDLPKRIKASPIYLHRAKGT